MSQQPRNHGKTLSNELGLGDQWHGLTLDHKQLVATVNHLRSWFNSSARRWGEPLQRQLAGNAMVIAGNYGTGKSHIARTLYDLVGPHHAVFWEEPDLVGALWDTYKDGRKSSERQIYMRCRHAPLLIIDDLGTAHVNSTGWLQHLYWQLFSYHPIHGRGGILITTNLPWQKHGAMPFADRVGPRALTRLVHQLGGPDPETDKPFNWTELFQVRDRRFDPQGIFNAPQLEGQEQ